MDKTHTGAFIRQCFNREEMHFAFTLPVWDSPFYTLGDVWFHWLNRGFYLGQRKIVLSSQVRVIILLYLSLMAVPIPRIRCSTGILIWDKRPLSFEAWAYGGVYSIIGTSYMSVL